MLRRATNVGAVFALGTLLTATSAAQQAPTGQKAGQASDIPADLIQCDRCHVYSKSPLEESDGRTRYYAGPHWSWPADPHRRASEVLDKRLGQQMAKILAKHSSDPESWKGGVRTDRRCTSCHGGTNKDEPAGVSCYDCHQQPRKGDQARDNDDWVITHALKPRVWRSLKSEQKQERGFRLLHDGAARAETCLSCHVGNAKEGKFVTHEMYAAGHPPLVSVELAKFSEDAYTEKHWLPAADPIKKGYGFPAEDVAKFRAQLSVQGAIGALLMQADLAAEAAKGDSRHKHIAWGDYSVFDCASCHHDLTEKSWRRQRAEGGFRATGSKVYGRPPLLEWPSALAFAVQGESLRQPLDDFRVAATETPFGNPVKVASAAQALRTALTNAGPKLDGPSEWRTLLRQTLEFGGKNDLDFDSARQVAWMVDSLATSLGDADPMAKAVKSTYSKLAFTTDPRCLPKWIRANEGKAKEEIPDLAAPDRLKGMEVMLAAKRAYDPATFREWCKKVLAATAPPAS